MIQLTDDFTLSKDTTLEDLANLFKGYNAALSTVKIGDCLITVAWGRETVTAVEQVIKPMLNAFDDNESAEEES
jgi:hypothetical protein